MKTLLCLALLVSAACVPMQPAQGGWGQPAAEPQPVAQASGGLGCMQIFDCFGSCNGDEACISACIESGDPAGQAAVSSLLDCSSSQCNNDGDCVATACRAEIDQCTGATGSAGVATAPPGQEPAPDPTAADMPSATAPILAWLEGKWQSPNHHFTFYPDGTVHRSQGGGMYRSTGDYKCAATVNETGTVTQEGDLLIMVFPVTQSYTCGAEETSAGFTVRYRIVWYKYMSDNWDLQLDDIDCDRGSMYCSDRMTRR